jgi:hypothetical protein
MAGVLPSLTKHYLDQKSDLVIFRELIKEKYLYC